MKYMMRFGYPGIADVMALHDGTLYGFEIKDIKGRQNENQVAFQDRFTRAGGVYRVIRDVNDVVAIFGKAVARPPQKGDAVIIDGIVKII
jgi:nucleoside-triphosphatase THEP1